jgi:photosystem II stability/assembly factor-like uncharacterized protein
MMAPVAAAAGERGAPGQGSSLAWQPMGPIGGAIRLLAQTPAFPQVVYAASSGDSLFRSLDGGRHWALVSDFLTGMHCIAVDPRQPRTVYVGADSGLWKSTDGGVAFRRLSSGFAGYAQYSVYALAIDGSDPRRVYAGVVDVAHAIYRSTDAGASWTPAVHEPPTEEFPLTLLADPTRPGTLYLGTINGLYVSRNYGRRWLLAGGGLPQDFWAGAVAVGPDGTLYVVAGASEVLLSSLDGGMSWGGAGGASGLEVIDLVVAADGELFALTDDLSHLAHSTAGGSRWELTTLPSPLVYANRSAALIADAPSPGDLLLAAQEGVFAGTDGGGTWVPASQGLRAVSVQALTAAPRAPGQASTIHGIFAPGTLRRNRRSTPAWISENPANPFYAAALGIDPRYPQRIWLGDGDGNVRKSEDGGMIWQTTAPLPLLSCSALAAIAVAPNRSETVYVAGFGDDQSCYSMQAPPNSFRTTDGGNSWQPMPIDGFGVVVDPVEPGVLFVFGTGVARSTDGGATWTPAAGVLAQRIYALAIDPGNSQQLFAAGSRGLLASRDRGKSFQPVGGLPKGLAAGVALDARTEPSTLFVAIDGAGVFASSDDGATWSPLGAGLPNRGLYLLVVDPAMPDTLYAGTAHGVYRLQRPPLVR